MVPGTWWRFLFRVLGLILVIVLLGLVTDVSLFSINTSFQAVLPQLDHRFLTLFSNLSSNERTAINQWRDAWAGGNAPLERVVQIALDGNDLTVDYSLTINSDHPMAKYLPFYLSNDYLLDAVDLTFGVVIPNEHRGLQIQDFVSRSITLDPEAGSLTVHFTARKEINDQETITLVRDPINMFGLQPQSDKVIVNYRNRNLINIDPLPDQTGQDFVSFGKVSPEVVGRVAIQSQLSPTLIETAPAKITRQSLLLKLDQVLHGIPLLSSILASILVVLPILMFLGLVQKWQGEVPRILLLLKQALIVLLTFHFSLFLIGGIANLFLMSMIRFKLLFTITHWLDVLFSNFNISGYTGFHLLGMNTVQLVLIGILIPAILLDRSRDWESGGMEPPSSAAGPRGPIRPPLTSTKHFPVWLLLTILVFLFALGLPWIVNRSPFYFFPVSDPQTRMVLSLCSTLFGASGILGLVLLGVIYRLLDGKLESLNAIVSAICLLVLGNIFWSLASTANETLVPFRSLSPYTGWAWLVYSTLLGAVLIYAFIRVFHALFVQAGWLGKSSGLLTLILILVAILTAIPMRLLFSGEYPADFFEVMRLAPQLDHLIAPFFLAGLVYYFYKEGGRIIPKKNTANPSREKPVWKGPALGEGTLSVGLIAFLLILYSSSENWLYIPLTFLIGYLFLKYYIQPAGFYHKELAPLYHRVFDNRIGYLEEIVSLNSGERSYRGLNKTLSQKMSDDKATYAQFKKKVDGMRRALNRRTKKARVSGKPLKDVALAFGPYETAWENGRHGAFWAAIFAVPWILIPLFKFMSGEVVTTPYPLWSFLSDLLNLALTWVGIGFLFGYFYPYLRGKNGMQKGALLWLVAVVPAFPLALVNITNVAGWQVFLSWALEMFIHCMLLGLVAFDYITLRQGYRDWDMLFEVHGIPSAGVSISTTLAAIVAAVITTIQTQAQSILLAALNFILPNTDKLIKPP